MPLPSSYSESSTLLQFFPRSLKSLLFSKLILCPPTYKASPFLPLLTLLRRMKYITALYAKVHFRFMQIVPDIPVLQAPNNELNTLSGIHQHNLTSHPTTIAISFSASIASFKPSKLQVMNQTMANNTSLFYFSFKLHLSSNPIQAH